jgi:hypothetical protein
MTSSIQHALDTEKLKQLAAEDIAVELGLLCRCPRHGDRVRVRGAGLAGTGYCAFATHDPALPLFSGNADELLSAVEAAAARHDTVCTQCVQ